jgi:hypothetical protein
MKSNNVAKWIFVFVNLAVATVLVPTLANAHCDTMNGPVVTAAKKALESGDVNFVLIWVQKEDESVIKKAFTKTLAVRKLGPEVQKMADMYFFETLVRIHRAGEGVAYTGLKLAETEVEPGIEAADKALERGSAKELLANLTEAIHHGVDEQFTAAMAAKNFKPNNLEAGRHYVRAYVEFIHYVERLYLAASKPTGGHIHESVLDAKHESH